jgi:hypothetical protein
MACHHNGCFSVLADKNAYANKGRGAKESKRYTKNRGNSRFFANNDETDAHNRTGAYTCDWYAISFRINALLARLNDFYDYSTKISPSKRGFYQ